jgi:hypothetical protein
LGLVFPDHPKAHSVPQSASWLRGSYWRRTLIRALAGLMQVQTTSSTTFSLPSPGTASAPPQPEPSELRLVGTRPRACGHQTPPNPLHLDHAGCSTRHGGVSPIDAYSCFALSASDQRRLDRFSSEEQRASTDLCSGENGWPIFSVSHPLGQPPNQDERFMLPMLRCMGGVC